MSVTSAIYDRNASIWARDEPLLLSDYTARPWALRACGPVEGRSVLDLGCGEGYLARRLAHRGAAPVHGIDVSAGMIARATQAERARQLGIRYDVADVAMPGGVPDGPFDIVLGAFLFSYLPLDATRRVLRRIHGVLRPGGRLVVAVPHPFFVFAGHREAPFSFYPTQARYTDTDAVVEGRVWRRDRRWAPVRCHHKTIADLLGAVADAGFGAPTEVAELGVTDDLLELDPGFFAPVAGLPLHLGLVAERSAG